MLITDVKQLISRYMDLSTKQNTNFEKQTKRAEKVKKRKVGDYLVHLASNQIDI